MSGAADPDTLIRLAAFERLRFLTSLHGGALPWAAIRNGFFADGRQFLFASAAEGIFKPREMSGVLSVKTVVPQARGRVWYSDQVAGDERVRSADDVLDYSFTGTDPTDARNQWLRDALERQFPIIYFYGVAPGIYEPLFPVFVVEWNPSRLTVSLAVSMPAEQTTADLEPPEPAVRRYAMRLAKHRLHQAMFREQVVDAYGQRCALLGIDPDYKVHIAGSLLKMRDGPMLDGIKALDGRTIRIPKNEKFRPDRDRLALRFEGFNRSI